MTERPVLFNAEMVRAILDGRKVETRRPVKPQPPGTTNAVAQWPDQQGTPMWCPGRVVYGKLLEHYSDIRCPFGAAGDLLYVRETHYQHWSGYMDECGEWRGLRASSMCWYPADQGEPQETATGYWRKMPSIHMLKTDSRIWLRVEEVRAERVQAISATGPAAEGWPGPDLRRGTDPEMHADAARDWFADLWGSIYSGDLAWSADPWVWVCRFSVVSTTGRPA